MLYHIWHWYAGFVDMDVRALLRFMTSLFVIDNLGLIILPLFFQIRTKEIRVRCSLGRHAEGQAVKCNAGVFGGGLGDINTHLSFPAPESERKGARQLVTGAGCICSSSL